MRVPIQYALTYPERCENAVPRLALDRMAGLTFEPVDREKFPCLDLAYAATRQGGSAPAVLNAANEVAVHQFLAGRIGFDEIATVIHKALDGVPARRLDSIQDVLEVDREVREWLERH